MRLLGPVSALLGTLLLISAAEDVAPGQRRGPVAACLLNATLVLNVGAVVMTPDTPLLFFWTAALAGCARLMRIGNPAWWFPHRPLRRPCARQQIYRHPAGRGPRHLAHPPAGRARQRLRRWQPWAAAALAAACFTPVVWWNATHGFVSFLKQGGRGTDWHPAQSLRFLAELLVGQVGLATPWVALMLVLGSVTVTRGLLRRDERLGLLACVTLLPAAVFCEHAIGGRVQANWPAIVFPGAVLAAACRPKLQFWPQASASGLPHCRLRLPAGCRRPHRPAARARFHPHPPRRLVGSRRKNLLGPIP